MRPGHTGHCTWDGDSGTFVVLAAHRARRTLSVKEGLALLGEYHGEAPASLAPHAALATWRTVLATECEEGFHNAGCAVDDCEQGQYCSEGSGARWVEVLGIRSAAARSASPGEGKQP